MTRYGSVPGARGGAFVGFYGFLPFAKRAGYLVDGPLYLFLQARWTIDQHRAGRLEGTKGAV
jgi:hypothetical protein